MEGQFLVLDQPLLGRPTLGQCILVREAYEPLWSQLQAKAQNANSKHVVVSGHPGVGKSFWLIWLLMK